MSKRKILIVMMDGFDPAYLQASDMANTKQMAASGFFKTVQGVMPSVTNVNNTGICCGGAASRPRIPANLYFHLLTREKEDMEPASLVLAPPVFERPAPARLQSGPPPAKKKTHTPPRT